MDEPPEDTIDLGDPDPSEVAQTIVLQKLTSAPRTRSQLAQVLAERNVPDETAGEVLDRFEAVGLINDAEFAVAWVRSRQSTRSTGVRVLRRELQECGVAIEHIEAAVADIDADAEYLVARELGARKWATSARLDLNTRKRRLFSLLIRRGYSSETAGRVISEIAAGADADDGAAYD